MRRYQVIYLDAFTRVPYAGNPCAVLPDAGGLSDAEMQAIAREANLSETSFVLPSSKADFRVRYFMPRGELPFAGHPTIATCWALAQEGRISLEEPVTRIRVEFNIGVLPVDIHVAGGQPTRVVMTQQAPVFGAEFATEEVAPCFGLMKLDLRDDCTPTVVSTGVPFLIVPATGLSVLTRVRMHRDALSALCAKAGVSAAYMFCLGGFRYGADTHARLLDPKQSGEDPYTGSAAGAMAAYIVRNHLKEGTHLVAEQGHIQGRPGEGVLVVSGPPEAMDAVYVGGEAVRTMEGHFLVA